jgi:hypothetical protein
VAKLTLNGSALLMIFFGKASTKDAAKTLSTPPIKVKRMIQVNALIGINKG